MMSDELPMPGHLSAVLDGLAENPALPEPLIGRLIAHRHGFGRVGKRADLTPAHIEEIVASGYQWLLHSLALNRRAPDDVRLWLAEHGDAAVRAALVVGARNGHRELFERLIDDPDTQVREFLAQSDAVPQDLLAALAHDPDPVVRATVARWWTQAPDEVRRVLLTDPIDAVRAAACSTYYARLPHPVPPADLLDDLVADPVTRAGVVRHLALTPAAARRLTTDPDPDVRAQLAAHPQLPADVRERLGEDPNSRVRVAVLARPDTPEPIRERIYTAVLHAGAGSRPGHPSGDVDEETLLQQIEDHLAAVELRGLQLPWVTADPLPYLASPYPCFRRSAACSPALTPGAVAHLLADDDSGVRVAVAYRYPHLVDPATAERIDRDFWPGKKTNWRPADDLALPAATLRRLATDPDPRMRCLAPRDPDLPADLASRLAHDADPRVRGAVAGHRSLPTPDLIALLADPVDHVACTAAAAPTLPAAVMGHLLELANV